MIPFISAMAMWGGKDGESDSYLDLADIMTSESVIPEQDCEELYRCEANASPDTQKID